MAGSRASRAEVLRGLRGVLVSLGDALAETDLEAVLAAEPELSRLTSELSLLGRLPADERRAFEPELIAAREALARCRRLGAALNALARGAHVAGRDEAYDRAGRSRAPDAPRALAAKV